MNTNKTATKNKKQEKTGNWAGSSPDKSPRQQIEKRAYELWLAGGCAPGNDVEHWLQAEREVLEGQ